MATARDSAIEEHEVERARRVGRKTEQLVQVSKAFQAAATLALVTYIFLIELLNPDSLEGVVGQGTSGTIL
jgi:ABC-type methionine transport system permease subunit